MTPVGTQIPRRSALVPWLDNPGRDSSHAAATQRDEHAVRRTRWRKYLAQSGAISSNDPLRGDVDPQPATVRGETGEASERSTLHPLRCGSSSSSAALVGSTAVPHHRPHAPKSPPAAAGHTKERRRGLR